MIATPTTRLARFAEQRGSRIPPYLRPPATEQLPRQIMGPRNAYEIALAGNHANAPHLKFLRLTRKIQGGHRGAVEEVFRCLPRPALPLKPVVLPPSVACFLRLPCPAFFRKPIGLASEARSSRLAQSPVALLCLCCPGNVTARIKPASIPTRRA